MESLAAMDRAAFLVINGWHSALVDPIMLALSDRFIWVPLYLFFFYLIQRRTGWRGLWWSLPTIALMVLVADKGSVLLFKETVQRLRPCHEPLLSGLVHLVPANCGGQYGFVSSHASNHFAIALFVIAVLRGMPRWSLPLLLCWAGLIAYSRVYLGVHYPGDVFAGGLYGALIGSFFAWIFHRTVRHMNTPPA